MKLLTILSAAACLFGVTSCAVLKQPDTYLPLVSPAVQLAATGVLDAAKTETDRETWVNALRRTAIVIRTIPDTKPTPDLIKQKILDAAPISHPLWTKLATTVADYYSRAVARVPNDLSAITTILAEVAEGLEKAAATKPPVVVEPEPALPVEPSPAVPA